MTSEQAPTAGIEALLKRLAKRLATASRGDRMYERPMSWDEADQLLAQIAALEDQVRSARADVLEEAVEAVTLRLKGLAILTESGQFMAERLPQVSVVTEELTAAIRALNPPESSNAAS